MKHVQLNLIMLLTLPPCFSWHAGFIIVTATTKGVIVTMVTADERKVSDVNVDKLLKLQTCGMIVNTEITSA